MKRVVLLSLTLSSILMADNLASTTQVSALKSFSPPKPIAPNVAQGYMIENQFDRPNRQDYFSTSNLVYKNLDKFHISSGVYGKSFYNSALFKYRGGNFYTNLNINHTKANSYKDGGGNRVGFGYERFNQAVWAIYQMSFWSIGWFLYMIILMMTNSRTTQQTPSKQKDTLPNLRQELASKI